MSKFVMRAVATGIKFDLCSANGEVIASSEVYTTPASCRRGMESVRKCAIGGKLADLTQDTGKIPTNPRFELFLDKRGAYRFRMRARNGEVIAHSEPYSGKAACMAGIESVITNAPDAIIEETK